MEQIDSYFVGQIARMQRIFSENDIRKWSLLTKDFNEVYESGFLNLVKGQPLVPGIISEGLITEVVSTELPGVPCVMMQKELVFIEPVRIGDTITAEVEIIDVNVERNWITEKVRCMNEYGIDVIKGQIILKLF